MTHILVVKLDDSQNDDIHEQFIKGLPPGSSVIFDDGNPNDQMRVFGKDTSSSWNPPHLEEYNWVFLRQQQNWANDLLRVRGYVFLNEIYAMLGFSHTKAGAILGWVYAKDSEGDNFVDFGCWGPLTASSELDDCETREGDIHLQFNATPILHLIDPV